MTYKDVLAIIDLADEIAISKSTEEFIELRREMQKKLEDLENEYHDLECSYLELKAAEDTRKAIKKGIKNNIYGGSLFDYIPDWSVPDNGDKFSEQDLPFPDVEEMAPAEEVEGSEE